MDPPNSMLCCRTASLRDPESDGETFTHSCQHRTWTGNLHIQKLATSYVSRNQMMLLLSLVEARAELGSIRELEGSPTARALSIRTMSFKRIAGRPSAIFACRQVAAPKFHKHVSDLIWKKLCGRCYTVKR